MKYYVNKNAQSNGVHEVHTENCKYLPTAKNIKYLGEFSKYSDAGKEAKKSYSQSNGCITFTKNCHTC